MDLVKKVSFVFALVLLSIAAEGQQTPLNPISYRVFNPFIFNPAIAGSKDFASIEVNSSFQGKYKSQILSGNARIRKTVPGYSTSPVIKDYSNVGIGGSLFNDVSYASRSMGISGAISYHFPLNKTNLSFLSLGLSVKGVYNRTDSVSLTDAEIKGPSLDTFSPNADVGIYYYGPQLFAGISATNIMGAPKDNDTSNVYNTPISRQYFLIAGYKFIISKTLNIVVEPSFIINADDSLSGNIKDLFEPAMKIYVEDFCFGTYFHDFSNFSFFFQYRYPGMYIGAYFEIPKATPYYKKELIAEFTLGFNLSEIRTKNRDFWHW
jgi:type IX secretion system PorP/SprF family membrane protein